MDQVSTALKEMRVLYTEVIKPTNDECKKLRKKCKDECKALQESIKNSQQKFDELQSRVIRILDEHNATLDGLYRVKQYKFKGRLLNESEMRERLNEAGIEESFVDHIMTLHNLRNNAEVKKKIVILE